MNNLMAHQQQYNRCTTKSLFPVDYTILMPELNIGIFILTHFKTL
jgi:hypothetical protein